MPGLKIRNPIDILQSNIKRGEQDTESAKAGEQRREEGGVSGEVQVATGEMLEVGAAYNECLRGHRGAPRLTRFNGRCKYMFFIRKTYIVYKKNVFAFRKQLFN